MFDIVIIGGNLSGSLAAINAARKDVSVALIEKHKEPCYPAHCGEGIADITAELLNLDEIRCPKNEIDKIIVNVSSTNLKSVSESLSRNVIIKSSSSLLTILKLYAVISVIHIATLHLVSIQFLNHQR